MKRFYLLLFLLLLMFDPSYGQDSPVTNAEGFTLEQCINYALENSNNLKNAALDERIANARVKETRGIGLPQVDGVVQVTHNSKLRRFFSTYDTLSPFFSDPGARIEGANVGDVVAAQNFFQLKSGADAGLNVTQLIFNSSYLVGLQAASTYRELSVKTTEQTKEQIIEQVTKAYYNALINQERMDLFTANITRVDSLLKTTRALFENGFAENIDVNRIQVTLNNLITERDNFIALKELSIELLKFQMNYPMEQPLRVKGNISDITIDTNPDVYRENFNYTQRMDYSILETQRRLQQLNIKNQYAASLPSLSAFANLGYSTQSPNIGGLFKTNTDISDNSFVGPDKWYPYMMFGVSLNVPIFSGLQRAYRIQQQKLELMKIENGFNSLKSGIDVEIKTATTTYKNALRTMESQKANMDLAAEIARVTKIKYEQGIGSNLEVVEAESALREAQVNYYNALFDALVAKVDLDKAYGKLLPSESAE